MVCCQPLPHTQKRKLLPSRCIHFPDSVNVRLGANIRSVLMSQVQELTAKGHFSYSYSDKPALAPTSLFLFQKANARLGGTDPLHSGLAT